MSDSDSRRAPWAPGLARRGVPAGLLVILGALPFLYHVLAAGAPGRLTKVALLVAFSGPMQARGNDLNAAVGLALQRTNAEPGRAITEISALDDQAQPQVALDQFRGAVTDSAIAAVLCCTTDATERAVKAIVTSGRLFVSLAATAPGMTTDEAQLARRQLGGRQVVIVSDQTILGDARAGALAPAFQSAGYTVSLRVADFAAGSLASRIAAEVSQEAPDVVVLDADYPAAAVLVAALRSAGVSAPMLGDDRLDGAPAAALLSAAGPLWYVALDRVALQQQLPSSFDRAFSQVRGHAASSRDMVAYIQARAALQDGRTLDTAAMPVALYHAVPGVFPVPPVDSTGGSHQ